MYYGAISYKVKIKMNLTFKHIVADEEADKERTPDDGELEGSGDDFEG